MPVESEQERAERQARLSQAMGAMFLQDKVEKLEKHVENMSYTRDTRRPKPAVTKLPGRFGLTPSGPPGQIRIMARTQSQPEAGSSSSRQLSMTHKRSPSQGSNSNVRQIRLIDASVLIFSLRTVHNWLKDPHFRAIVPLEAINTLDLLKKGDHAVNVAARKATRFLEENLKADPQCGPSQASDGSSLLAHGLAPQRDSERVSLDDLEALRQVVRRAHNDRGSAPTGSDVEHDEEDGHDHDRMDPKTAPLFAREVLSAAAFLHRATDALTPDNTRFAVAVAHPPPADTDGNSRHLELDFGERVDGKVMEARVLALGLPVQVVGTAKSWIAGSKSPADNFDSTKTYRTNQGSSDAPVVLQRSPSRSHDRQDKTFVPPLGFVKGTGPNSADPERAIKVAPYGSIAILKSRSTSSVNTSQESFQTFGTEASSPRMLAVDRLGPPSERAESTGASVTDTESSGRSVGPIGMSGRPLGPRRRPPQTAAERMEAYVKSLS